MGPRRKSRSVNRCYNNEVSPSKDDDSTKRHNSQKRKLSDMLGPRWTTDELSRFYDAYRKYSKDWKKVASVLRSRSPDMVEALYTMNRAYLSLPHGTASAAGLIAMMTDHYCNLAGSNSDPESGDGAGSSRKTQKLARGKFLPTSHSQVTAPDYGCLSLLKKKRSGGNRPCAVGKRTPRFPISYTYENFRENYASPTSKGLKRKANANDDEVAQEIAIALADTSQKGGTSKVSRSPSKIPGSVLTSPIRYAQRKHSLAGMNDAQNLAAAIDDEELEASIEAGTDELSRCNTSVIESECVATVKLKAAKLEGTNYEVGKNKESLFNDIKEECSGIEEGQRFDVMRGSFNVESQEKKSKKVLFGRDDASAFDALQTLADLSLMMPTEDEDDSRLHCKEEDDNHVTELVLAEALPMNQKKEKRRYGVAPSKTSKQGKASVISSVPEESQDPLPSTTKTSRRKEKMPVSKILKTEANPDIHLRGYPEVEDGDRGKKLMNKSKKSSQTQSPHLSRNSEKFSFAGLRKEASVLAQPAVQVTVVNHVSLPTKIRSRRKTNLKKPQVQIDPKLLNNISSERSLASPNLKENLSICMSNPLLRRWCIYEFFYSAIDYPWFAKREFVEYLHHVGLGHLSRLTRVEWGVIGSSLGKPRRFSKQFLREEKEKLNEYRNSVRKHYTELREGIGEGLPTDLAKPLSVGQRVTAIHPKTREIHDGSVLTVDHSRCRVQFDRHELGVEFVMDIDCMPLNPLENLPAALLGKQPFDQLFENSNELKIERVQESMKSPSANPASLIGSAEIVDCQQTSYSQPSIVAQIQAKEADVQALANFTRALDKKEAVIQELRCMNDDVYINHTDGDSSLKESEPFKKQYAAILVQLNEANEQVSSALYRLRQRNTYKESIPLVWSGPATHANEIIDGSTIKAREMVDAAVQAMSSLKSREDSIRKIEEVVDYVNNRLPSDDSCKPVATTNPEATTATEIEPQKPVDLISKCVATLLMIKKCTERQFPPSDVAQILESAVVSLQPRSSQNLPVYSDIERFMGIIRNQIMALVPT